MLISRAAPMARFNRDTWNRCKPRHRKNDEGG
jgi:hypothetical protein